MTAPAQNQPDYEARNWQSEAVKVVADTLKWTQARVLSGFTFSDVEGAQLVAELVRECAAHLKAESELATLKQQLAGATANAESVIQDEAHDRDEMALLVLQKDAVIVSLATAGQALLDVLKVVGIPSEARPYWDAFSKALADAQAGTEKI